MVEINFFCFIILFTCLSLCGLRIRFVKSTRILYKGNPTCEILVVNQCIFILFARVTQVKALPSRRHFTLGWNCIEHFIQTHP